MDRRSLRASMEQFVNGASFITQAQLCKFTGMSRTTVYRKTKNLDKVSGKYFFIPDVVNEFLK